MADHPSTTGDPRKKLSHQRLQIDTSIPSPNRSPTLSSNTPRAPPLHPTRTHSASDAPPETTRQHGAAGLQDAAPVEANEFMKAFSQLTEAQFQIQSQKNEKRRLEELSARHKSDLERARKMKSYPATLTMLQEMKDKGDKEIKKINASLAEHQEICQKVSAQFFTKGNFSFAPSSSGTSANRSESPASLKRDQERIDKLEKELAELKAAARKSQAATSVSQWPTAEFYKLKTSVGSQGSDLLRLMEWKELFDRRKMKFPLEAMPEVLSNLPQDLKAAQAKADEANKKMARVEAEFSKITQDVNSLKSSTSQPRTTDSDNFTKMVDEYLSGQLPSLAEQIKQNISGQLNQKSSPSQPGPPDSDNVKKIVDEYFSQQLPSLTEQIKQNVSGQLNQRSSTSQSPPLDSDDVKKIVDQHLSHQLPFVTENVKGKVFSSLEKSKTDDPSNKRLLDRVSKLEATRHTYEASTSGLETRLDRMRTELSNLTRQDLNNNPSTGEFREKAEQIERAYNQINGTVLQLKAQEGRWNNTADKLDLSMEQLRVVRTGLGSLEKRYANINTQELVRQMAHAIMQSYSSMPQLIEELQTLKNQMNADLQSLKARVDTLPTPPVVDVDRISADIQSLRDRIDTLPTPPTVDVARMSTDIQSLSHRIDTLPPPPIVDVNMEKVKEAIKLHLAPIEQTRQIDSINLSKQLKDLHELQEKLDRHSTAFDGFSDDTSGDLRKLNDADEELKDEIKALAQHWQAELDGRTSQYESLRVSFEDIRGLTDRLKVLEPFDRIPEVLDSLGSAEELAQLHDALKNRENTAVRVDQMNELLGQLNTEMSAIVKSSEEQMNTIRSQLRSELAEKLNEMFSRERKNFIASNEPDSSNGHAHQVSSNPITPEVFGEASAPEQQDAENSESDQLGAAISSMFDEELAAVSGQDITSPSHQLSESLEASGYVSSAEQTLSEISPSVKRTKLVSSLKRANSGSSPSELHIRGLSNSVQPKPKKRARFADSSGDESPAIVSSSQVNATSDSSSSRASKKMKKQMRKERRREARKLLT